MKKFHEYILFLDSGIEAWSGLCEKNAFEVIFSGEILSSSCEELRD